tara:strand:- start:1311 stop:2015 length:705 start_codon:yes stop_codon:yes gene_type:complete
LSNKFIKLAASCGFFFNKYLINLLFIFFTCNLFSQENIKFQATFNNEALKLNKNYNLNKYHFNIKKLKFYVSNISYYNRKKHQIFRDEKVYLVDFNNPKSLKIKSLINKKVHLHSFDLGLDSIINVSGSMGGALDPIEGMYWAWQSGYINFKVEWESNMCTNDNNQFIFHLGGYKKPYYNKRTVLVKKRHINKLTFNLNKFLKKISCGRQTIMSPSLRGENISNLIVKSFEFKK